MEVNHIRSRFPHYLRESLIKKFHRIPSAPWIAKHFNIQTKGEHIITSETVRKWLNGTTIPSPKNMATLIKWLNIDHNSIYQSPNNPSNLATDKDHLFTIDDCFLNTLISDSLDSLDKSDKVRIALSIMALKAINDPNIFDFFKNIIFDEKSGFNKRYRT